MSPECLRSYPDVKTALSLQFQLDPFFAQVTSHLEDTLLPELSQIDILSRNLDQHQYPSPLQEQIPLLVKDHVEQVLLREDGKPEENLHAAGKYMRALSLFRLSFDRLSEWKVQQIKDISEYKKYERTLRRLNQAWNIVNSPLDSTLKRNVEDHITLAESDLYNHLAEPAMIIINNAFSGQNIDEETLHTAGTIVHQSSLLNEQVASTIFTSDERRNQSREAGIKQHLVLIKNDLLGYHGDSPLDTAVDTVWHGKRIFQKFYVAHEEKRIIIDQLQDLANYFVLQIGEMSSEKLRSLSPSEMSRLVSLREIDELLLEEISALLDPQEYSQVANRLIETYQALAVYHESTQDIEAALSDYRNACEISQEQKRVPSDEILFGLIKLLRERAKTVQPEERVIVWSENLYHRLKPVHVDHYDEKTALELAAEISLYEEQLDADKLPKTVEDRMIALLIYTIEEPSEVNIGLLKQIIKENPLTAESEPTEMLRRLVYIGEFISKGWQEQQEATYLDFDALYKYKDGKQKLSFHLYDQLRGAMEATGVAVPETVVQTDHAGVRIMIKSPNSPMAIPARVGTGESLFLPKTYASGSFVAAAIIPKPMEILTIQDVQIPLNDKFARRSGLPPNPSLEEILQALHEPVEDRDVQSVQAVSLLPVIPGPSAWIDQPPFAVQITTSSAARTFVIKEGKIVGSFITTEEHPTIDIAETIRNSPDSFLWKPNLPEHMSADETRKHGDLVGTIQLISIPIVVDTPRDERDGKTELVPSPPGGIKLPYVRTRFNVGDDLWLEQTIESVREARQDIRSRTINVPTPRIFTPAYIPAYDNLFQLSQWNFPETLRTLTSYHLGNLPSRQQRGLTRQRRTTMRQVAIETSREKGDQYGTFDKEIRRDHSKPISCFTISLVGASEDMEQFN